MDVFLKIFIIGAILKKDRKALKYLPHRNFRVTPRVQGKVHILFKSLMLARITPACAGKSDDADGCCTTV